METALIGIDWGTSRLRGFRIAADGQILERRASDQGIAKARGSGFNEALKALIGDWRPQAHAIPILMCGMIGSRQGWMEVPYHPCPLGLGDLVPSIAAIETSLGIARIVGGISMRDGLGVHDIIRGEETQMFGADIPKGRQLVVAPGTHSKWAVVDNGRIEAFRTYMTGEMFDLLCHHSSLGWLLDRDRGAVDDDESFLAGVFRALDEPELLHTLFSVRTRGLFENSDGRALPSYLSGLLIGSEVAGEIRRAPADPICVIASAPMARLYRLALSALGHHDVLDVDADESVARGLWRLWRLLDIRT